jgi:hypothetical protein
VTAPVTHTFSVDLLTTTATNGPDTEYTPATVTWTISGTAISGDSISFGVDVVEPNQFGVTFSATFSALQVVELIGASFSSSEGFELSVSGNQLTLISPWGSYYNGLTSSLDIVLASVLGSLSATTSDVEMSGGVTTHNLSFVAPAYFGFDESVQFQITM